MLRSPLGKADAEALGRGAGRAREASTATGVHLLAAAAPGGTDDATLEGRPPVLVLDMAASHGNIRPSWATEVAAFQSLRNAFFRACRR